MKPLIVLDAQNIAMRHGKDKFFSTKGIEIAVNFWSKNGHKVVSFLPDYLFDYDQVAVKKVIKEKGFGQVKASHIPDDVALLRKLRDEDYLISTPSQDYDDSYCI